MLGRKFVAYLLTITTLSTSTVAASEMAPDRLLDMCRMNPAAAACPVRLQTYTHSGRMKEISVAPTIVNGTLLVPIRSLTSALGATVDWDSEKKEVKVTRSTPQSVVTVRMYPAAWNNDQAYVMTAALSLGGTANVDTVKYRILDAPPTIINGAIHVPIRFIAEALNIRVGWRSEDKTAAFYLDDPGEPTTYHWQDGYTRLTNILKLDTQKKAFDLPQPSDGFPVYPASYNEYNRRIGAISYHVNKAVPGEGLSTSFDVHGNRIRISDATKRIEDIYATHTITWLDAIAAERYRASLQRRQGVGAVFIEVAALILMLFLPATFIAKIVLVGVSVLGLEFIRLKVDMDAITSCITEADIISQQDGERFTLGLVHSPHGMYCITRYVDEPLFLNSPRMREVSKRV